MGNGPTALVTVAGRPQLMRKSKFVDDLQNPNISEYNYMRNLIRYSVLSFYISSIVLNWVQSPNTMNYSLAVLAKMLKCQFRPRTYFLYPH